MFFGKKKEGFAFIELIISIAVFTFIATAMFLSFSRLRGDVSLTSLAYDTALTIRQAQSYGVQTRGREIGGSLSYNSGYGVRFGRDNLRSFAFFADDPLTGSCSGYNRRCEGSSLSSCLSSDQLVKKYDIVNWNSIEKFCAVDNAGSQYCSDATDSTRIDYLDVSFLRPKQDAFIRTSLNSYDACDIPNLPYKSAYIRFVSDKGKIKTINITVTGQITVN